MEILTSNLLSFLKNH